MSTQLTYHEGELEIQQWAGEQDAAVSNGRIVADRIPAGARRFVAQQRYCVFGWADAAGDLWATFLTAPAGFAEPGPDLSSLRFNLPERLDTAAMSPAYPGFDAGMALGILFIELESGRRLRVNGLVTQASPGSFTLGIRQAYPNCRKYIQRRALTSVDPLPPDTGIRLGRELDAVVISQITAADTFFVASAHPDGSLDASHRGGKPGFIDVRDGQLWIPDYPGNSMFNTLGNFLLRPSAGITFVDFSASTQLQLTGDVRLELNGDADRSATSGTGRYWCFLPRRWVMAPLNATLTWTAPTRSPFNP